MGVLERSYISKYLILLIILNVSPFVFTHYRQPKPGNVFEKEPISKKIGAILKNFQMIQTLIEKGGLEPKIFWKIIIEYFLTPKQPKLNNYLIYVHDMGRQLR